MDARAVACRAPVAGFTRSARDRRLDNKTIRTEAWNRTGGRSAVSIALGASTGWYVGLGLGIVVIAVAALIVIEIVRLAQRIARQADGAVQGVEQVHRQTDALSGIARINDSGVRILHSARALRKVAV